MKYTFKFLILLLALFSCGYSYGQEVPLGAWKDYLSYRNGLTVALGKNTVYCVAGSAMFSYGTSDNSIEKLNKVTGLSDVNPSVARCSPFNNSVVVGYTDGNIDIIQNKIITNLSVLKTSNLQGSKTINSMCFLGNYAFVGCGQGIMQIDLTQDVILNTFYFGPSGSAINVRGVTILNDTIFAATDGGVYLASLADPDINNFNDWHLVPYSILPYNHYNTITTVGDSVFVNWSSWPSAYVQNKDTIYVYCNGHWHRYKYLQGVTTVYSLEASQDGNTLVVSDGIASSNGSIDAYNRNGIVPPKVGQYIIGGTTYALVTPNDAVLDANNVLWVADNVYGLVKVTEPYQNSTVITPQGPYNNDVFSMAVSNNDVWVVAGGYDGSYTQLGYPFGLSTEQNTDWSYITSPSNINDLNCVAVDPFNPLHVYAGSWGGGVVEYNNNKVVNVWNESNSCVQSLPPPNNGNCRVGGLAFDTLGNLWVTSSQVMSKYLSVRKTTGVWDSINFGISLTSIQQQAIVSNVIVTQSQAKWMLLPSTGIVAYQDNGTFATPNSTNTQLINNVTGNGGLPDLNIYCMAVDANGSIWVGTDQRVVVFYSPDNVFDGNHDWDAQPVYVTQTGYTQYLMQNQITTAIAIDGANRKWIGTQGGGVFLMSADGTQQIYNFTTLNSPLISNNIISIVINPANGEVFFATDKGIVSYKGTATEGLSTFGNVYAYPDPVPHDYSGPIAIKNLVTNADVKITTINGELVYHTIALGGQAIWNGTNFDGKRVQTGVYLVFCASPDGSQTLVSKLLFIN